MNRQSIIALIILCLSLVSCNRRYFYLTKVPVSHTKPEPENRPECSVVTLKPHLPVAIGQKPAMKHSAVIIHKHSLTTNISQKQAGSKERVQHINSWKDKTRHHTSKLHYLFPIILLWILAAFFLMVFAFSVIYIPGAFVFLLLSIAMAVWAIHLGIKRRKLRLAEKSGPGTDGSEVKLNGPQMIGRILLWILAADLIFLTFPLMSSGYALFGLLSLLAGIYMIYLLRKHNKGYYRIEK